MNWPKLRVGDITHVVTKGTTPTKDQGFVDSGVNFIKAEALNGDSALDPKGIFHISKDVHQKLKRSILQEDDVLLTIAGAQIGKCGIVRPSHLPANTNQAVGIMRVERNYHIITSKKRLNQIARDFVEHYSTAWESGKAMFVCIDKITCVRMYELIKKYWAKKIQELEKGLIEVADEQ